MKSVTLLFLAAFVAMACAAGQYYVPRAYYLIDAEGHETAPVPLRRLRRSLQPYPSYPAGSSTSANANAKAWGGGSATANAYAVADSGRGIGGWGLPLTGAYGAANPAALSLSTGQTRSQAGPILGARSVSAGSSVGVDSTGNGYYDQYIGAY